MNRTAETITINAVAKEAKAKATFGREAVIKALEYGGMQGRNCGPVQVLKGEHWIAIKPLRIANLSGLTFDARPHDRRATIRFNEYEYPQALDSKGRPIFKRYTRKQALASMRYGKGNKFLVPVQEGQEARDSHGARIPVLDFTKPSPKEDSNGKYTMKIGESSIGCRIKNSNFERANLRNSVWVGFLNKNRIENCDFSRSNWDGATMRNVVFKNCDMRGCDFTAVKQFKNVAFVNCNMRGARIHEDMVLQNPINSHLMDGGRKRSRASTRRRG